LFSPITLLPPLPLFLSLPLSSLLLFPSLRSGELTAEYEQKKAAMLQAQEETAFSFQKKKVSNAVTLMEAL